MWVINEFRGVTLYGTDGVRAVKVNFIFVRSYELAREAEVCDFDVHFLIKQDVLCFDIAMSESFFVKVTNSSEQLFKDVSGSFFLKHFSLVYQTKKLSVLGYFHDIIHYSIYFAVNCSIYSPDIEVNNLNYIPMFCFEADFDLVKKHVESFLLVSPLDVILLYFVIHDLNGHSFIIGQL